MNSYLTLVILLNEEIERSDYEYLMDIASNSVPLIVVGTEQEYLHWQDMIGKDLSKWKTTHIDPEDSHHLSKFYSAITTPYWVVTSPYELLAENFLQHASSSLATHKITQPLCIYLLGFLSLPDTKVQYSQLTSPELGKPLRLHQLFDSTLWFHPLVKMVFHTELCHEHRLFPSFDGSFFSNYHSFVVEYLGALYISNNYTEPETHYYPAPFLSPMITVIFPRVLSLLTR